MGKYSLVVFLAVFFSFGVCALDLKPVSKGKETSPQKTTRTIDSAQAQAIANKAIKDIFGADTDTKGPSFVFYWNDDCPLYEFTVVNAKGKILGDILISADKRLPPVISASESDKPSSSKLVGELEPLLKKLNVKRTAKDTKIYISPPLRYIAKVEGEKGTVVFWDILRREAIPVKKSYFVQNLPKERTAIDKEWAYWESEKRESLKSTQDWSNNIFYNQNCEQKPTGPSCKPNAISGCTPVAVATWFAHIKQMFQNPAHPAVSGCKNIYTDSCWDKSWGYSFQFEYPPSCEKGYSPQVNERIWQLHAIMKTTADGATQTKNIDNSVKLLREFGCKLSLKEKDNPSIQQMAKILTKTGPFLVSGWEYWSNGIDEGNLSGDDSGRAGHTLVCTKIVGDLLKLNLGWGKSEGYKYFNYTTIQKRRAWEWGVTLL